VADITYIRLQGEFVYLAVILDAFSGKVVGWELDRKMTCDLTKTALERAIAARQPAPGLVHHSDRGVQGFAFCAKPCATGICQRTCKAHIFDKRLGVNNALNAEAFVAPPHAIATEFDLIGLMRTPEGRRAFLC